MPRKHIRKQTDHQRERLGKHSEKFDKRHHRYGHFKPPGYIGPEYIFPIMLGTENIDSQKCTNGQYHCDGNVSGHIRSTGKERYQSHEVIDEDKEKGSQQIRSKLLIIRSHATLYHIVVYHHNEHFHETDKTTGCQCSLFALAIPMRHAQNNDQQQYTVHQQRQSDLCNRNVPRTNLFTGLIVFHDLPFILASGRSNGKALIRSSVLFKP